jgi:general secretion pathway protein D
MHNLLIQRRNAALAAGLICLVLLAASWAFFSADAATAQGPALNSANAGADEPVLKSYDTMGQDPAVLAAKLQSQLPANAGINIATDKRSGKILVLAVPSAQELIVKLLHQAAPAVAPAALAKNAPAAKADPGQRTERSVTLAKLTAAEFEAALSRLANRQLPVTTDATGQIATYTLAGRDNTATMLSVNRTDRTITVSGGAGLVEGWSRVITAMDQSKEVVGNSAELVVPVRNPEAVANGSLQRAMTLIGQQTGGTQQPATNRLASMLFQPRADQPAPANQPPAAAPARTAEDILEGGLSGPVQIEYIESLDIIVIKGNPRDVEKVSEIIKRIEEESLVSVPEIVIYPLQNVSSDAMASLVRSLYDQVLSPRQGRVSITSLVKPNSLLLIGRKESITTVVDLIKRLDVPVDPAGEFRIFELKHTSANEVLQTVQAFLSGASVGQGLTNQNNAGVFGATITATGLGTRAVVTADYRTNSLIVRASKRDLDEIAALLKEIDKSSSSAVNDLKVFNLKYSLAEELAPVLQSSITGTAQQNRTQGQQGGQGQQGQNQFQQGLQQLQQQGGQNQNAQQRAARSIMLQFLTVDSQGKKLLKSGLLTDVRITADGRANSIIVSAPAESMELIGALIRELDQMPTAEAQIKVFTIQNGDAANLVTMLQNLFGLAVTGGGVNNRGGAGGGNFNFAGAAAGGDTSGDNPLVGLRFSVDQRTNSIIVSGSSGDLNVVEAILLRLDESDIRQRKSTVYRLKNAPSIDVANSINQLLNSQRQLQQVAPAQLSPFEQIEKEVIVVPEQVSNSLIISATPRYFDEIRAIIEQLDMRPPMVMIQVLIAEVQLANNDEFGVELGVQDSVLFDRSLLGNLVTTTNTTTFGNPATTVQQQTVLAATNEPGFNFNNTGPLPNSGSSTALAQADNVGSQGLTNFALGRTNNELGFGGLVLSASSNSLSVLLRALSANRRLEVLSRPQIMTLDNQPAFIQVGQRVPRITSVSVNLGIQNNAITLENVGLILGVTPRISPDGLVVMEIDAEKSEVGPESEGVPIFVNTTGQVVRSPRFNTSVAQTTVSAANGQTIILGGLIAKSKTDFSRRAPFLSDIPVVGHLFRYDSTATTRRELLIIMTPRVVRTQQDSELIKQVESARMSWCLSDVMRIHGPSGLRTRKDHFANDETLVIYPDQDPNGEGMPHMVEEEGVHHMLPGGELVMPGGAIPEQIMSTPAAQGQIISGTPTPSIMVPNKTEPGHSIPGETGTFSKPIPDELPPPLPPGVNPRVIPPGALPKNTVPGAEKSMGQRSQQALFRSADPAPVPTPTVTSTTATTPAVKPAATPNVATGPTLTPATGPTLAPQANIQLPPSGNLNAVAWQQQMVGAPGVMPAGAWQAATPLPPQQPSYAQPAVYQTPVMPPAGALIRQ